MNNNPGAPVTGEDHYNRIVEQRLLIERATGGVHTNLSAARRIGKTSIMRQTIINLQKEGWIGIEIDFSSCKTIQEFVDQFTTKIHGAVDEASPVRTKIDSAFKSLRNVFSRPITIEYDGVKTSVGAAGTTADETKQLNTALEDIGDLIDALANSARAKRLVMGLDELPIFLTRFEQEAGDDADARASRLREISAILYSLRQLRQRENTPVFWLHCGSIGLESFVERLCLTHSLSGLQTFSLEAFSAEHTRELLRELWRGKYKTSQMPEPVIDHIILRIGWLVPYYTQFMFHVLHEQMQYQATPEVPTVSDVDNAYEKIVSADYRKEFQPWYDRLDEQLGKHDARLARVLIDKACGKATGLKASTLLNAAAAAQPAVDINELEPQVRRMLGTLERDGYFAVRDDTYFMRSPLLRDYWRKHCISIAIKRSLPKPKAK